MAVDFKWQRFQERRAQIDSGMHSLLSQLIVYPEISLKEWMEFKKLATETSGSDKQIIISYKFTRLSRLHHGPLVDNLELQINLTWMSLDCWEEAAVPGYREKMQTHHMKTPGWN